MNGQVKKLCDINGIEVPQEMLDVHVDEAQIEAQMNGLSLRYAKEETVQTAGTHDTVYCTADKTGYPDGRTVLLYIGTNMPGAEKAEQAVCGKKTGEVFKTELCGKAVTLTVEKIVRRTPVEVNDALIASVGIEGVETLADYRKKLYDKAYEDAVMERDKALMRFYMDQMIENSIYEYDEAEMHAFADSKMDEIRGQCEELGEPFDEADAREGVAYQMKQGWMAEAFCKANGIAISEDEIREQADQMAEMMGLMGEEVPSEEELLETARQDAAVNGFFERLGQVITEKTGGANGNG